MATFRAKNNKKAFEDQPSELIKKNEQTGEVMFAYDSFIAGGSAEGALNIQNGDVVLACKLPAFAKPLRVTVKPSATLGSSGDIDVGFSASSEVDHKVTSVTADPDAFLSAWDGTSAGNMAVTAPGYLKENVAATFVALTFNTAPDALAGQTVEVIVEYVAK